MFNYLEKVKNEKETIEPTFNMNIASNISLNTDLLKALDFDNMSDQAICDICLNNYQQLFDDVLSDVDTLERLITTPKFLINFSHALYSINLTESQKMQLCNIIYVLKQRGDIIGSTKMLLQNLGKIVNKELLPKIMYLGLDEELSTNICIARYSSKKNLIRVKRINTCIMDIDNIVDSSLIIKVYEALGYFSHFTDLFNGIMFDRRDCPMNDIQKENYSSINMALVTIMEEMPTGLLYTLLLNFIEYRHIYANYNIRFNIASCNPTDFPRINAVIDQITIKDKLLIPF